MNDDLVLLILTSGDSVLGQKVNENNDSITLTNLLQMVRSPQGIAFVDYYPVVDEKEFTFDIAELRHNPLTPNQNLKNMWNQKYGSGIQIAGAGSLGGNISPIQP